MSTCNNITVNCVTFHCPCRNRPETMTSISHLTHLILLEQTITLDMFSFVIIIHGLFIIYILGASSSYCTVSAQILMTRKLQQKLPYLAKFKSGLNNWWKVCCYRKLWFRYILFSISAHLIQRVMWALACIFHPSCFTMWMQFL